MTGGQRQTRSTEPAARTVRDYADAALWRVRRPLDPGHEPDWADRPSRFKTYPDADLLCLPDGPRARRRSGNGPTGTPGRIERSLADTCAAPSQRSRRGFTVERLAWLLRMSYGVLARRIQVDWNHDGASGWTHPAAIWGRGTPSGGGLYPIEIYWVAGAGGSVRPGIYHYSAGHHALERLASGPHGDPVRSALHGLPDASRTDHFLLATARFWKNAFKYASFGYHIATQDVGALLGSWDVLGRGLGVTTQRVLWFDDEALNRVLGLDPAEESVLAVVPLRWSGSAPAPVASHPPETVQLPAVDRLAFERSHAVRGFPLADRAHRATLVGAQPRPARGVARSAATERPVAPHSGRTVLLPPPSPTG